MFAREHEPLSNSRNLMTFSVQDYRIKYFTLPQYLLFFVSSTTKHREGETTPIYPVRNRDSFLDTVSDKGNFLVNAIVYRTKSSRESICSVHCK